MKKILSIIIILTTFLFACKKTEQIKTLNKGTQKAIENYKHYDYSSRSSINKSLETLTLSIVDALQKTQFRTALKTKALEKFDGDFDFLLNFKDPDKYSKIETNILNSLIKINNFSRKDGITFLQELNSNYPLIQIAIPIHCNDWDVMNYIPSVLFLPIEFNDQENYSIKGFDSNGNEVWFNKNIKPVNPVIVISQNERRGSSFKNIPPGGGGGGGNGGGNGSGYRTNGNLEYVKNINFSNLNAVESWMQGRPEIRLRVFAGSGGAQISSDYFHPKRSWVNNSWWLINHSLLYWNTNNYGNFIILKWIEEDGGNTITVSSSYTYQGVTTTISYQMKDNDDEIGGKTVGFTDPLSALYDTGIMKWHEKF